MLERGWHIIHAAGKKKESPQEVTHEVATLCAHDYTQ